MPSRRRHPFRLSVPSPRRWWFTGLVLLAGTIAPFARQPATPPPVEGAAKNLPTTRELQQRLPGLPDETKRQLLYLCARLNRPAVAEQLAREILSKSPGDRPTLLVMCSMYLERKDAAKTLKLAREFLKHYPKDDQGWDFVAAACQLQRHSRESANILRKLKAENFQETAFPYHVDLAAAARDAGDWCVAARSYRQILDGEDISDQLERESRVALDEIYRSHLPQAEFAANWFKLSNGNIVRTSARWECPLTTKQRLFIDWDRDDVSQESDEVSLNHTNDRNEGLVAVENLLAEDWRLRLGCGGSGDGGRAAGQSRHTFAPQCELALGIEYGRKSTDSLALELLDGRQEQVTAGLDWRLTPETVFHFQGTGRHVRLADTPLGEGFGFNLNVDQTLLKRPFELVLGYEGEVSSFSVLTNDGDLVTPLLTPGTEDEGRRNALDGLINSDINRHAFVVTGRGRFIKPWSWEVSSISGYSIDRGQVDYGFTGGMGWFIRKSLELHLRAGYLSSGSDSNQGSEVREISVVLKSWF